jgi:hypothetical protein
MIPDRPTRRGIMLVGRLIYVFCLTISGVTIIVDLVHSEPVAKGLLALVRVRADCRRAFALGTIGDLPVFIVAPRRPDAATNKLKGMRFVDEKALRHAGSRKFTLISSGLMFLESDSTLVLQCRRPPLATVAAALRRYFHGHFNLASPWTDVAVRSLADDDQGDVDGSHTTTPRGTHAVSPAELVGTSADQPNDWQSDEAIKVAYEADPPRAEEPDTGLLRADETDVRRLILQVQGVRKLAGAGDVQDSGDLQRGFETLLGRVPKERALLALVAYPDIDDAVQFATGPSKPPLSADDTLVAEAVDALMALCLRAKSRDRLPHYAKEGASGAGPATGMGEVAGRGA